jgi:hypothetical protein
MNKGNLWNQTRRDNCLGCPYERSEAVLGARERHSLVLTPATDQCPVNPCNSLLASVYAPTRVPLFFTRMRYVAVARGTSMV